MVASKAIELIDVRTTDEQRADSSPRSSLVMSFFVCEYVCVGIYV